MRTRWWATTCVLLVTLGAGCTGGEDGESGPASLVERTPSGEIAENGSPARPAPNPTTTLVADAPDPSTSLVVEGQRVQVAELNETVARLCLAQRQASTNPEAAKATYDERSRASVATIGQALQPSYAIKAASIAEARAVVEADLGADPPRSTLGLHLELLTASVREGLAYLGIPTSPCQE